MSSMTLEQLIVTLNARDLFAEAEFIRAHIAEMGEPVAEVYERPVHHDLHNSPMMKDIRFTGMPFPVGTKLYTAAPIDLAAVCIGFIKQAIAEALTEAKSGNRQKDQIVIDCLQGVLRRADKLEAASK